MEESLQPVIKRFLPNEFSDRDRDLALFLLDKNTESVEVSIPEDVSSDQLIAQIEACCKVYGRLDNSKKIIQPIIGRLMMIMEDRPDVLAYFGVNSVSAFCADVCPRTFGIARSEAFAIRNIVEMWPSLSPNEFCASKTQNLKLIGKATDWKATDKAEEYREFGKTHTYDQLIEKMRNDGIDVDEIKPAKITKYFSHATRDRFNQFVENPVIRQYCESSSHDDILNRMIDECSSSWIPQQKLQKWSNQNDGR